MSQLTLQETPIRKCWRKSEEYAGDSWPYVLTKCNWCRCEAALQPCCTWSGNALRKKSIAPSKRLSGALVWIRLTNASSARQIALNGPFLPNLWRAPLDRIYLGGSVFRSEYGRAGLRTGLVWGRVFVHNPCVKNKQTILWIVIL